jgi:tetratricopeptide (TPR) repeat protein
LRSIRIFVGRYLLVAGAAAAAWYSFLLARASWLFQQDTASSVPAALNLVPYNSAYLARLAAWKQPEKIKLLQRAIELNPFDFESLIQLGLAAEFQDHDIAGAEHYYLRAAQVNKMFLPKWTLTNFYFRRNDASEFFRWAAASLAITPYAPEPIFVQMWLMSQDCARIARTLPDRPRILLPYAWFLSNTHQYEAIPPIVRRLISDVGRGNPHAWGRDDLLASIEDRMVAEGDRAPALSMWANMAKAGWIQQDVPSNAHPITNANFRTIFYRHGFDWTSSAVDGLHVNQSVVEGLLRLQFSGEEPEHCTILRQFLPMEAGHSYTFRWQVESRLLDLPSGLTWHLVPVTKGAATFDLISGDLALSQSEGWRLRAPAGSQLYLLTLEYERPLGHLRAKGTVLLKSVDASLN